MGDHVLVRGEEELPSCSDLNQADEVLREVVRAVHPTLESYYKRSEVIKYLHFLINSSLSLEAFPYGSVPLKTYLPDGDIDLTVICNTSIEDSLLSQLYTLLKQEEDYVGALYEVKDVHCIEAEVKLIKCMVQNIAVDISFNQLGGMSTLCFLEQVDQLIGKDHLFKSSVILIKAWCYYESRILGAPHGLISTYALEVLVLYIINLFHSSLSGPLSVLHRFLDYFSKFDWEKYCISLNGPLHKSSLPDFVVDLPENVKDELLLSNEFLKECAKKYSKPATKLVTTSQAVRLKHLNIIDPLRENNNLGRSVNRGNFYRIRTAFKYGACKLAWLLNLPGEKVVQEFNKFFVNTLKRGGINWLADAHNDAMSSVASSPDNFVSSLPSSTRSWSPSSSSSPPHSESDDVLTKSSTSNSDGEKLGTSCSVKTDWLSSDFHFGGLFGWKTEHNISCSDETRYYNMLVLDGDYENHFNSILYGRHYHLHGMAPSPFPLPHMQNRSPWETVRRSINLRWDPAQVSMYNASQGPFPYSVYSLPNSYASPKRKEERRRTRTYIPTTFHSSYELLEMKYAYIGYSQSPQTNACQLNQTVWGYPSAIGFLRPPDRFCSGFKDVLLEKSHLHRKKITKENPKPVSENEEQRIEIPTYQLDDEVHFPTLSR